MGNNKDDYILVKKSNYQGWLVDESLIKRSLAVMGHYCVAWIILFVPLFILGLAIAGLGSL